MLFQIKSRYNLLKSVLSHLSDKQWWLSSIILSRILFQVINTQSDSITFHAIQSKLAHLAYTYKSFYLQDFSLVSDKNISLQKTILCTVRPRSNDGAQQSSFYSYWEAIYYKFRALLCAGAYPLWRSCKGFHTCCHYSVIDAASLHYFEDSQDASW